MVPAAATGVENSEVAPPAIPAEPGSVVAACVHKRTSGSEEIIRITPHRQQARLFQKALVK